MSDEKPANITLQHFLTTRQMSDSWDGCTECLDGYTWTLLIYKDRVVGSKLVGRVGGSTETRRRTGGGFWWHMLTVSLRHMAMLHIARHQFFRGRDPFSKIDTTHKDWDVVEITSDVMRTLSTHPQYLSMVKDYELTLEPLDNDRFRVKISKFKAEAA